MKPYSQSVKFSPQIDTVRICIYSSWKMRSCYFCKRRYTSALRRIGRWIRAIQCVQRYIKRRSFFFFFFYTSKLNMNQEIFFRSEKSSRQLAQCSVYVMHTSHNYNENEHINIEQWCYVYFYKEIIHYCIT